MNSLRSDSISYFVAQIAYRNQRLNTDSKDLHSSKDLLVRNVFENLSEETTSVERSRRKNHGVSRHTKKAQKVVGLCDFLFKPLAEDWRGVGEWSEVLLRTRRIRWM